MSLLIPAVAMVTSDPSEPDLPTAASETFLALRDEIVEPSIPGSSPNATPGGGSPGTTSSETTSTDNDTRLAQFAAPAASKTDPAPDSTATTAADDVDEISDQSRKAKKSDERERNRNSRDKKKSRPNKPTTTTTSTTTTTTTSQADDKPASPEVSGTITGNACPCTVKGTVELKGNVSLQGDLMVMGGTLVARPGVNLEGNGYQIMFMEGGRADFQGSTTSTWSGRGSSQNLERDINFKNLRRIMFHKGAAKSTLRYFRVSDSGSPALGDYPIHFHLNGNSTRGTLVEGVVVVGGKHHAFVPHGSHGITFKDVIAKNTRGDAFWWDPPGTNESCNFDKFCTLDNSNDIRIEHALVDGVTNGPGESRGYTLTGFLLSAGSGNSIRNSVAINVNPSHVKNCSGFHWPSQANQNAGGNVWTFVNNHGQSRCHGIFVWQNDSGAHVVNGFTGGGIDHGAYKNNYLYDSVDVPYFEIHAQNFSIRNSKIGDVKALKHNADGKVVISNSQLKSFTISNASNSGKVPGHYEFVDTNLTCGDVVYDQVVPGTTVTINGKSC